MVKQLLLFKFKASVPEQTINTFFENYKKLESLDSLVKVDFGKNISTEGFDKGFKYGAVATFENKENVKKFLNDPKHIELAEKYLNPFLEDFVLVEYKL